MEFPNGRVPAREFLDALDDRAAARIDAFIDRLRVYGNRMQGKFVKKLTNDIFELRVTTIRPTFRSLFFYQPGMLIVITSGFQKKTEADPAGRNREGGTVEKTLAELSEPVRRIAEGTRDHPEGVWLMKRSVKRDKHAEIVERRARKSASHRKAFSRTFHQIDLALLVREMREDAALTQTELAKKVAHNTVCDCSPGRCRIYRTLAHDAGADRSGLWRGFEAPCRKEA